MPVPAGSLPLKNEPFDSLMSQFSSISLGHRDRDRSTQRNVGGPGPGAGSGTTAAAVSKQTLDKLMLDENSSTAEQLGTIWENVYLHKIDNPRPPEICADDVDEDEDSFDIMNNTLETLGALGTLLEPISLEPSDISTSIGTNTFQLIKYKREIQKLDEIQVKSDHIQALRQEVQHKLDSMKKLLVNYEAELEGDTLDEMETITKSYQVEIDAEESIYEKLKRSEPIYSGARIHEAMNSVKHLQEKLETLKKELWYSSEVPPNFQKARDALATRKEEFKFILEEISHKTDGMTNF